MTKKELLKRRIFLIKQSLQISQAYKEDKEGFLIHIIGEEEEDLNKLNSQQLDTLYITSYKNWINDKLDQLNDFRHQLKNLEKKK